MLCTLNLYSDVCQLLLNKTEKNPQNLTKEGLTSKTYSHLTHMKQLGNSMGQNATSKVRVYIGGRIKRMEVCEAQESSRKSHEDEV